MHNMDQIILHPLVAGLKPLTLFCLMMLSVTAQAAGPDWLIDPAPYRATVTPHASELVLENGLARRIIRLAPNAATIELQNLVTGEQLLRAIAPEARVTINGTEYAVGGLIGAPVANYIDAAWLPKCVPYPKPISLPDGKS